MAARGRSAVAVPVVPYPLQKSLGPRIGLSFAPRSRLRLAPLEIGAQPLGKTRLPVVLRIALPVLWSLWRVQSGFLRLEANCVHLAAQAYSRGAARLKVRRRARMSLSALALGRCLWQKSAAFATCCGSSVVEHSLGKGEVESSILSRSTIFSSPACYARRSSGVSGRAVPLIRLTSTAGDRHI
jgi:hypothetical protein